MKFYIDPGTGSMLFTILIGMISAAIYGAKNLLIKIRFKLSGDKGDKLDNGEVIDYAILTDDKRYWNLFKPICDEFEKRGIKIVYFTASEDDPALEVEYENVECVYTGKGNKSYANWNRLRAHIVLSTTPSLDVYQWKRSKDVDYYVHIPHAVSDITLYRMFGIDYYDAIILTGDYQVEQIRKLEKARGLKEKELIVLGMPSFDAMLKRIDENEKDPSEKDEREKAPCVLLAPSWGPSSIFNKYGGRIIEALLKTDNRIIVRPHPQSFVSEAEMLKQIMDKYPESERINWNQDTDNFDVLQEADVLISDFSGVLFDYSMVFDKPIIYADTSFNKAPYDAAWLDGPLWTFEVLPRIGIQLTEDKIDNIGEIIKDCINNKSYEAQRSEARKECWQNIGNSAESIADYLIKKREERRKVE